MGLLARLFLGSGTLKPELRATLEAEGLVLLEEGLRGRITYRHFRAPGKRFHGKVVPLRLAIAVTERRLVAYASSGRAKLLDTPWDHPNLHALDVALDRDDTVVFRVDYGRMDRRRVSGEVTIRASTSQASAIVEHAQARRRSAD